MAYSDDAVLAKLSALNESQEAICSAAQWIMFHRRHADRTVAMWQHKIKESPSAKRLILIYLANEVTQQSKARNKDDFVLAFAHVIAEATATAYRGAAPEVQHKIRRVVEVWKDRAVFEVSVQEAIEARINELDTARGVSKASFGGSRSSSSTAVPSELVPLVASQQNVSKLFLTTKAALSNADRDYEKNTDPQQPVPSAPVYAARLSGLLKTLATAEGAVAECVKARKELIGALEKLLDTNKAGLEAEETQLQGLTDRKAEIDQKKQDVETTILRGLANQESAGLDGNSASPGPEPDRPEMEALTPPAGGDEPQFYDYDNDNAAPGMDSVPAPIHSTQQPALAHTSAPGIEMLSNLASQYQAVPVSTNGMSKKRKIDSEDDFPDLGNDGIDPNIDELIQK